MPERLLYRFESRIVRSPRCGCRLEPGCGRQLLGGRDLRDPLKDGEFARDAEPRLGRGARYKRASDIDAIGIGLPYAVEPGERVSLCGRTMQKRFNDTRWPPGWEGHVPSANSLRLVVPMATSSVDRARASYARCRAGSSPAWPACDVSPLCEGSPSARRAGARVARPDGSPAV